MNGISDQRVNEIVETLYLLLQMRDNFTPDERLCIARTIGILERKLFW